MAVPTAIRTHTVVPSPIGPLTAVDEDGELVGLFMDAPGPSVELGGNEFQLAVWRLMTEIPYGETRSYGDLARRLGDRTLAQAVGAACGRNPLPVVVPCHRVVGADGSLVGFGGGLGRKRFLLDLEQRGQRLF
jgi:methylated-DNA-[protein]-cysteine S-methyltransferase